MFQWIRDNLLIKKVINSCSYSTFHAAIMTFVTRPKWHKYFTSKWYLWNIIRPRDFYKMISMFIIEVLTYNQDDQVMMNYADDLLKLVLSSDCDLQIKKSFVWNITKKIPLMTEDTIRYMSPEKIESLLLSGKNIICDDVTRPFISTVLKLQKEREEI